LIVRSTGSAFVRNVIELLTCLHSKAKHAIDYSFMIELAGNSNAPSIRRSSHGSNKIPYVDMTHVTHFIQGDKSMAMSKALQTKMWWEEVGSRSGAILLGFPTHSCLLLLKNSF
jgi:hypothetical protein